MRYLILLVLSFPAFAGPNMEAAVAALTQINGAPPADAVTVVDAFASTFLDQYPKVEIINPDVATCEANLETVCIDGACEEQIPPSCASLPATIFRPAVLDDLSDEDRAGFFLSLVKTGIVRIVKEYVRKQEEASAAADRQALEDAIEAAVGSVDL